MHDQDSFIPSPDTADAPVPRVLALDDAPFGAVVRDIDCSDLQPGQATALRQALTDHQLLVFPGQDHLSPADEVAFYRALDTGATSIWRDQVHNPWEVFKVEQGNVAGTWQLPGEPGVLVLGKGDIDHHGLRVTLGGDRAAYGPDRGSQVLGGGALQWHIDGAFYDTEPCHFTQMRCVEAPSGPGHWLDYGDSSGARLWCEAGATAFASGRVAYTLLDAAERKRVLGTRVHYLANPFQATYRLANSANGLRVIDPEAEARYEHGLEPPGEPVTDPRARVYPLVWDCAATGKPALMPQPRCLSHLEIDGIHLEPTRSRLLVEHWMRPAIEPTRVVVHAWQAGDLVIWNNRSVWHSATGRLSENDRRVQHLTAFNGSEPPRAPCPTA